MDMNDIGKTTYTLKQLYESMVQKHIRATLLRGGTSKGAYFVLEDMPDDESRWDQMLLKTFGSPDSSQVDGIGGSHSTASKVMIVSKSEDPEIDLDFQFAQVSIDHPIVDWGGNCGNMTFAVGPFGLERGLITKEGDETTLVLRNKEADTIVEQTVPLDEKNKPRYDGDFHVHGLPRPGARIRSTFRNPAGSQTDRLFPTGKRKETISVDGVDGIEISVVDVANPVVFVHAQSLGLSGTELPKEINNNERLRESLERIRSHVCAELGFAETPSVATVESPRLPLIAFIGPSQEYKATSGRRIGSNEIDIVVRAMSVQNPHHAYAVTGGMCTAAAALLEGTVPNHYIEKHTGKPVSLGHPKGVMEVGVEIDIPSKILSTSVDRTARLLMDGCLYYIE
ncbi:2-methylaconitate cis-trans isomerase PrpF family protein [Natrialbaceae archaeon A-chndr2]